MKKSLTIILLLVWGCVQAQEDFLYNGLWYEVNSEENPTVSVIEPLGIRMPQGNEPYSGDVVIPSTVEYSGITYTVNEIHGLYSSSKLTSVTIPESVTYIRNNALVGVKNINYSGLAEGSPWGALTVNGIIDGDFIYSDEQKSSLSAYIGQNSDVVVPTGVKTIEASAFAYSDVISVVIPDGVVSIGNRAFRSCERLTSVTIPESVTSIGEFAFAFCYDLVSITLPETVTSIGYGAFQGSMMNVNYSGSAEGSPWDAQTINGLVDGDYIYLNAEKKEISYYVGQGGDVVIPDGVTSIGDFAFAYNDKLVSVTIPESVVSIGTDVFWGSKINIVDVPETVTSIDEDAFSGVKNVVYLGVAEGSPWGATVANGVVDGDFVYFDAEKKKMAGYIGSGMVANVPEGVDSLPDGLFEGCKNLTSVTIPGTVSTIPSNTFIDCPNLTSVTLSEGVKTIKDNNFIECEKLLTLTIPESVTEIGDFNFIDCSSLTKIIFKPKECPRGQWPHCSFRGAVPGYIYMYVPCEAMESYLNYYFFKTSGSTEDYLKYLAERGWYIECIQTDVPYITKEQQTVAIVNDHIVVNGEAPAFVYTIMGQKIANQNLKAGVYFVVIDGKNVKVLVK